jgi:Rrf2 family protein
MISKKCKYAIKAVLYIARKSEENRPPFAAEIAENEHIPLKFLETILRELKNNRILLSKRGKMGGYVLLKKPEEIKLMEIIRIMDGPIALSPCVSLNYYSPCDDCNEATCMIKKVFEQVRDVTLEVLGGSDIKMMVEKEKELRQAK